MSEYYDLILPAISALSQSTSEARQIIYTNARSALVTQLHSMRPALLEEDIQSEVEALEEAIERIERDVTGNAPDLGASRPSVRQPTEQSPVRSLSTSIHAASNISAPEEIDSARNALDANQVYHIHNSRADASDRNDKISQSINHESVVKTDLRYEQNLSSQPKINIEESTLTAPRRVAPNTATAPAIPHKSARSGSWILALMTLLISLTGIFALLALKQRDNGLIKSSKNESNIQSKSNDAVKTQKQLVESQDKDLYIDEKAEMSVASLTNPYSVDRVYPAKVIWRLETIDGEAGTPAATAIRGDIVIPDARMKVTLLFRKNADLTLSASHTISILFRPESAKSIGDVKAVGPLEMRRIDAQSAERLVGAVVPMTRNHFVFGLMRGAAEKKNIENIRSLPLIDIPLQFSDGRIATINLLKGNSGSKLFAEGVDSWINADNMIKANH